MTKGKEFLHHQMLELKAQVEELNVEVASLKQQFSSTGKVAVDNYVAYFHETTEYDGFGLCWRGIACNEILKWLAKLHPQMDLAPLKEEFIVTEPSSPVEENKKLNEAQTHGRCHLTV